MADHQDTAARRRALYEILCTPELSKDTFISELAARGVTADDHRVSESLAALRSPTISAEQFDSMLEHNHLMHRVLLDEVVVANFPELCNDVQDVYEATKGNTAGANASYIPQLDLVNPEYYGVSLCTVDGQRFNVGDTEVPYCVQSCSKPITYCMAQELMGSTKVHKHVGVEPSGRPFNEMCLDNRARDEDRTRRKQLIEEGELEKAAAMTVRPSIPHNPLINSGAIMTAAMVQKDKDMGTRFDYIMKTWTDLAGVVNETQRKPTFANSVYLSERETADRNMCLGYMMQEEGAFPDGVDLIKSLELYFMCCSIEATNSMMAVIAATLANHGLNPITGKRIFKRETVRNALSVMGTCGMYDFSGEFAFRMGFPAKSGVGGGILIVIPNVMGIATFSPRLDDIGNSVRGVDFCRQLSQIYRLHNYEHESALVCTDDKKRLCVNRQLTSSVTKNLSALLWAAKENQVDRVCQILCRGMDASAADYDGRTALHLAASEGHLNMVRYLLLNGADPKAKDRYHHTPADDAALFQHADVVTALQSATKVTLATSDAPVISASIIALDTTCRGFTTRSDVATALRNVGLCPEGPRLKAAFGKLPADGALTTADLASFFAADDGLSRKALQGNLKLQNWTTLQKELTEHFEATRANDGGKVATYIPELARANPQSWGMAFCSIDAQQLSLGDAQTKFCAQSTSKPITFCIAMEECGEKTVFRHIGREPSGRAFNEMVLDRRQKKAIPHNPFINAGAIMACSLVQGDKTTEERVDHVLDYWERLAGGTRPRIDYATAKSESGTADRNRCLAFMMKEAGAFPETIKTGEDLMKNLEFYFRCCSIMQDAESMAVIAATLANNGICPLTNERIFKSSTVRDCLSLMYSCGMYDDSGHFAHSCGFPCKSGVAGALLIVIPNVAGMCTWSPRLGPNGNSVRGMEFCERITGTYSFHVYEDPLSPSSKDITWYSGSPIEDDLHDLIAAAACGDINEFRRLHALHGSAFVARGDYDGRTALHLAAAEGQVAVLKFAHAINAESGSVVINLNPIDRWGKTPLMEAKAHGQTTAAAVLETALAM